MKTVTVQFQVKTNDLLKFVAEAVKPKIVKEIQQVIDKGLPASPKQIDAVNNLLRNNSVDWRVLCTSWSKCDTIWTCHRKMTL